MFHEHKHEQPMIWRLMLFFRNPLNKSYIMQETISHATNIYREVPISDNGLPQKNTRHKNPESAGRRKHCKGRASHTS